MPRLKITLICLMLWVAGQSGASALDGNVKVCVSADFEWTGIGSLDLPLNLIFEDGGYFSGELTQSDKDYIARLNRSGSKDDDGKPLEGAFILTEAIHLTKAAPCGQARARMLLMVPYLSNHGTAANHHVWTGWRILGLSGWHDDFGKPGGVPLQLGLALDDFHIRAMLLTDLGEPVSISSEAQRRLLNTDGAQ